MRERGNEDEKKRMRERKGRGKKNKEERKIKRKENVRGKEKKEGKKKVEIGEETLLKFAGVPLGKFLKINIYLKLEVRVFPRGSFVDSKNW